MKHKILTAILASFALLATSCGSDDDFTPGAEPVNGSKSVYFAPSFQTCYVYDEQPLEDTIDIKVVRNDTAGSLTVPIIIEQADTCLHIPESVTFEAGKDTTSLLITCPYIEFTKEQEFKVRISDEYADIYKEKEGITHLTSTAVWSVWETLVDTCIFESDAGTFPKQGCKIENLKGQNRFRFTDFLGSEHPWEFKIVPEIGNFNYKDIKKNRGLILPLKDYYYYPDWGYYFFCIDWDWIAWTPKGASKGIAALGIYPQVTYTWIDFNLKNPKVVTIGDEGKKYRRDIANNYGMLTTYQLLVGTNESYFTDYIYMYLGYAVEDE